MPRDRQVLERAYVVVSETADGLGTATDPESDLRSDFERFGVVDYNRKRLEELKRMIAEALQERVSRPLDDGEALPQA